VQSFELSILIKKKSTLTTLQQNYFAITAAEEHKCLNSELWHACAGPLVSLPGVGSRVVYFPQGHSEQVSVIPL
jgi:hypothetical protein